MTNQQQGGFIKMLLVLVVGFFLLFLMFSFLSKYSGSSLSNLGSFSNGYSSGYETSGTNPLLDFGDTYENTTVTRPNSTQASQSPVGGQVSLLYGNASYSTQPYEEYVVIRNSGSPVNITGWTLTNGKGTRPIETIQNSYVYPVADSATIGVGTEFLDPSGNFQTGPIILANGDSAIVTTGGPFAQFPFSISTSFRENTCVGYLENYPFEPRLNQSCPLPTSDPQIRTVTDECYDYMRYLSACKDPQKYDKKNFELQTSQCRNFMTARLNYPACVAHNRYTPGFASKQWRVFLGKKSQMWASQKETITLYDSRGLIVDQISY